MGEHPANAVRTKKDSSIVVGCRLVKEGQAQGFFSAGSTGACLAAATLVMGRAKGVARPTLLTVLPSPVAPVVMCDVGANADCKPEYLVQFAQMASVYAREVVGIAEPKVGLLNIGSEEAKGSAFAQECYKLLSARVPEFAGNCEGGDILEARFDVVVTDGFTGNVCLKTIEGTASVLFKAVKGALVSSPVAKLGALAVKGGLTELKGRLSAETYGGAPLLGVEGRLHHRPRFFQPDCGEERYPHDGEDCARTRARTDCPGGGEVDGGRAHGMGRPVDVYAGAD